MFAESKLYKTGFINVKNNFILSFQTHIQNYIPLKMREKDILILTSNNLKTFLIKCHIKSN